MINESVVERAAKVLCKSRGIDPNHMIPHTADPNPNGLVPGIILRSPAWVLARTEIVHYLEVEDAIHTVDMKYATEFGVPA